MIIDFDGTCVTHEFPYVGICETYVIYDGSMYRYNR